MRYFAKSTGGFYDDAIHTPEEIPHDVVEITVEKHAELLAGQSSGKLIVANANGSPELADRPAPTARDLALAQIASIESAITPRRMREATLTTAGKTWLAGKDAEIATLRASL